MFLNSHAFFTVEGKTMYTLKKTCFFIGVWGCWNPHVAFVCIVKQLQNKTYGWRWVCRLYYLQVVGEYGFNLSQFVFLMILFLHIPTPNWFLSRTTANSLWVNSAFVDIARWRNRHGSVLRRGQVLRRDWIRQGLFLLNSLINEVIVSPLETKQNTSNF